MLCRNRHLRTESDCASSEASGETVYLRSSSEYIMTHETTSLRRRGNNQFC